MQVKKFEAETLDQALKAVKEELGSEAIILKTTTHKGLGGMLKKKIEVTAAISKPNNAKENSGYANLGLNRSLQKPTQINESHSKSWDSELDSFLSSKQTGSSNKNTTQQQEIPVRESFYDTDELNLLKKKNELLEQKVNQSNENYQELKAKYQELESFLSLHTLDEQKQSALGRLRTTLKTLDLDEIIIKKIIDKAQLDFKDDQLQNDDLICDYALSFLEKMIHIREDVKQVPVTVLISEGSCGQSSLACKLAAKSDKKMAIVKLAAKNLEQFDIAGDFLQIDITTANKVQEALLLIQEKIKTGFSVILDFDTSSFNSDDVQTAINSLVRFYDDIDVQLVISAIHSQLYNRNLIGKYYRWIDGVNVNYLDRCLSVGELLSCHYAYRKIPLCFFGVGANISRDFQSASGDFLIKKLLS